MKIKYLPLPIKEVALQRQREKGNEPNEEMDLMQPHHLGGFLRKKTAEGYNVWCEVNNGNYEPFYALYPDKRPKTEVEPQPPSDGTYPVAPLEPKTDMKQKWYGVPAGKTPTAPWEPKTGERVLVSTQKAAQLRTFLFKNQFGYACVHSEYEAAYESGTSEVDFTYWPYVKPSPTAPTEIPVSLQDIASWKGCKPEQIKIV